MSWLNGFFTGTGFITSSFILLSLIPGEIRNWMLRKLIRDDRRGERTKGSTT